MSSTVRKFTLMEVNGELASKPKEIEDLKAMRRILGVLYESEEMKSPV